jgi:hypothetical protein
MKKLIVIVALIVLGGCVTQRPISNQTPPVETPSTEDPAPQVDVTIPKAPILTVSECRKCTEHEARRNGQAVEKIRETLRGECFREGWMKRELIQTNGKTNAEVLEHITSANVTIQVEMYRSLIGRVHGYTYPNSSTIWMNRKYHDSWNACTVGSNLAHEFSHKIGYDHDYKATARRPNSVPYAINTVFDECCK